MAKKIFISGGEGFIGSYLKRFFSGGYGVSAGFLENKRLERQDAHGIKNVMLDITDKKAADEVLNEHNPDIIIHAAGIKNVQLCEENKKLAYAVNVLGTRNMAEIAADNGAFFVYLSTDYVFDGNKGMYKETDTPEPWTYYGVTKLQGEKEVIKSKAHHAICRSSGVYNHAGRNVANFIIDELKNKREQEYYTDVFNSPTYLADLANMLKAILDKKKKGIFNLAGSERISRYEFALKIARKFDFNVKLVKPFELGEERRKKELRPFDVSLDVSNAERLLNMGFMGIDEGLQKIKEDMRWKE